MDSKCRAYNRDYQLAEKHLYYFYNTINRMKQFINQYNGNKNSEKVKDDISSKIRKDFIKVMDDDFNTSAAIAQLHLHFKYINTLIDKSKNTNKQQIANTIAYIFEELREVFGILGFLKQNPENFIRTLQEKYLNKLGIDEKYINNKIKIRKEAKENKDFNLADQIRKELELKGIILKDSINVTTWDLKDLY